MLYARATRLEFPGEALGEMIRDFEERVEVDASGQRLRRTDRRARCPAVRREPTGSGANEAECGSLIGDQGKR